MSRFVIAIEKSFDASHTGIWSDIVAAAAFLACITAGLSWLSL